MADEKQLWIVAAWDDNNSTVLLQPTAIVARDVKEAAALAGMKIQPAPTSFADVVIEARPFGRAQ